MRTPLQTPTLRSSRPIAQARVGKAPTATRNTSGSLRSVRGTASGAGYQKSSASSARRKEL